MMPRNWCGDDMAFDAEDIHYYEHGSSHELNDDDVAPVVKHAIGYIRTKPRIRIKAWSRPIIED
jgi:hypothetical protein